MSTHPNLQHPKARQILAAMLLADRHVEQIMRRSVPGYRTNAHTRGYRAGLASATQYISSGFFANDELRAEIGRLTSALAEAHQYQAAMEEALERLEARYVGALTLCRTRGDRIAALERQRDFGQWPAPKALVDGRPAYLVNVDPEQFPDEVTVSLTAQGEAAAEYQPSIEDIGAGKTIDAWLA